MIAASPMLDRPPSVIPPAPVVHPKDLPAIRFLLASIRNSLAIWPDYAFDTAFTRNTLFGTEGVLINDPAGIRQILATNVANYVRPAIMPRILRPLIGRGLFLAEGGEWRRQRRLLSPSFTPNHVNILLGAGPRICIGAVFALAEAQIMLATILQHYTLSIESKRPVMPVGRLTVQPSHAPMFKLERTP